MWSNEKFRIHKIKTITYNLFEELQTLLTLSSAVKSLPLNLGSSRFAARCIVRRLKVLCFWTISIRAFSSAFRRGLSTEFLLALVCMLLKCWTVGESVGESLSTCLIVMAIGESRRWNPSTLSQKTSSSRVAECSFVIAAVTDGSSSMANLLSGCLFTSKLLRHSTEEPHL